MLGVVAIFKDSSEER